MIGPEDDAESVERQQAGDELAAADGGDGHDREVRGGEGDRQPEGAGLEDGVRSVGGRD
ncbi:hypothetical protein [Halomicrobium salinisoli]|uniref:hypothetical protein n=1 Tax=Halomicrobium salinisoli TaxID=2878391 RepID=UPI001CEFE8D8|nr:hypothetical protein [Halomicrobium salinisoli]